MASFLFDRRMMMSAAASFAALTACAPNTHKKDVQTMHGIIAKIRSKPDDRDALAQILAAGTKKMPGCKSYVIALDASDETALWITEVWDSAAAHAASLQLPSVRDAITKGRPLITGMEQVATTAPIAAAL